MWISRKKYNALKENTVALLASVEDMKRFPYLIGLERVGRVNKFTFARGGKIVEIETMGLISDNLPQWKEELLR